MSAFIVIVFWAACSFLAVALVSLATQDDPPEPVEEPLSEVTTAEQRALWQSIRSKP